MTALLFLKSSSISSRWDERVPLKSGGLQKYLKLSNHYLCEKKIDFLRPFLDAPNAYVVTKANNVVEQLAALPPKSKVSGHAHN